MMIFIIINIISIIIISTDTSVPIECPLEEVV